MGTKPDPKFTTKECTGADPTCKNPTSTTKSKPSKEAEQKNTEGGSKDLKKKGTEFDIEEFGNVVYGVQSFGQ